MFLSNETLRLAIRIMLQLKNQFTFPSKYMQSGGSYYPTHLTICLMLLRIRQAYNPYQQKKTQLKQAKHSYLIKETKKWKSRETSDGRFVTIRFSSGPSFYSTR